MKKPIFYCMMLAAMVQFAKAQHNPELANMGPKITFEALSYDFGKIKEGDLATYDFKFTNTGNMPLVVINVTAQCGCTAPDWSRDTIPPGGNGRVRAVYNSAQRPGAFDKYVTVKSNAVGHDVHLRIMGDVMPKPIEPISPVRNKGLD